MKGEVHDIYAMLYRDVCLSSQSEQRDKAEGEREWGLSFLRSPVEFIADGNHSNRVSAIRMEINQLEVVHACSR